MCILSKRPLTPPACWFPPSFISFFVSFLWNGFHRDGFVFDRFRWNSRIFVARGVEKGPVRQAGGHLGMWSENYYYYFQITNTTHSSQTECIFFFFICAHFWRHVPMNFMSVCFIYLCSVFSFHLMKLNKESSAFQVKLIHFIFQLLGCWIFLMWKYFF